MGSSPASPASPERPWALWLTGLPAAGKTVLARAVVQALVAAGRQALVIDGDELRAGAHRDLGFDRAGRAEQARRLAGLARAALEAGCWPVVAAVSPYRADRAAALAAIGRALEVHVATPLATCARRDPKGLYAAARRGALTGLTGVDAPYEESDHPDLRIDSGRLPVADGVAQILALLAGRF